MAEIQWIKLKVDMFDNEKIKLIEAMPDADSILVIWVKLLTYAGKVNSSGYIMLTENIPMNEEELATIFNRPLNTIRYAIQVFERYGMIERDNDAIRIKNWNMHQNVDGMDKIREQNRLRKQKQRQKSKSVSEKLPESTKSHVTSRDSHDTEEEKRRIREDKEIDKERDRETLSPSHNQSVFDIFNDRGIDMSNSQACFNISRLMDGIDDLKYLHKAIDVAEQKGVLKAPYLLSIIKNWFEDGKTTYSKLMEIERKQVNSYKNKSRGTPNSQENRGQYKGLGF